MSELIFIGLPYITLFLRFFPKQLLNLVLIETNKKLQQDSKAELTYGEFLLFLGLQLFMSTLNGYSRNEFWSSSPISLANGSPFRLNEFMSRNRFNDIIDALSFTDEKAPTYRDKFWEVRKMISLWNENMADVFIPSWITCLDESMSI